MLPGIHIFMYWPCWSACPQRLLSTAAGSSNRNHKTKEGLGRRGEAEAVEGDLQHNPGLRQTKVLPQQPPCECHTATGRAVWAALPLISGWKPLWGHIPCWTRQSSGQNCLSTIRIQSSRAAVALWHCARFCRDTTSRRHFLRLWLCWTFSSALPWTRLKLSGVSQRWRESRTFCAMQWARNIWMHRPLSPWRGS